MRNSRNLLRIAGTFLAANLAIAVYSQTTYAFTGLKKTGTERNYDAVPGAQQVQKNTLYNVLKELNVKKGVFFLFSDPALGSRQVNNIADLELNVEKILEQVLKNSGLKYKKVSDNTFVILSAKEKDKNSPDPRPINFQNNLPAENPGNSVSEMQFATITGTVTGDDGKPMMGVSIQVKGTSKGTTTNSRGEFSIEANKGDVLVISFIGYSTQELVVGDDNRITVFMAVSENSMNEVVVTALGIRKESRRVGYAVTKVAGSDFT